MRLELRQISKSFLFSSVDGAISFVELVSTRGLAEAYGASKALKKYDELIVNFCKMLKSSKFYFYLTIF